MLQTTIFILQRLFHQHFKQVWCFVHLVVHLTFVIGMIVKVSKIDQLKVLVVSFFPPTLWVSNGKVLLP
jgi:hypothetical protein